MDSFKLDEIINEYKNPQSLLHLISGIGAGILICAIFPMVIYDGLVLGIIVIAVGILGKHMIKK